MDNEARIPEWLRRKMMPETLSLEEYGKMLDERIAKGEITTEEAEDDWQDRLHRGEDHFLGVYGW